MHSALKNPSYFDFNMIFKNDIRFLGIYFSTTAFVPSAW